MTWSVGIECRYHPVSKPGSQRFSFSPRLAAMDDLDRVAALRLRKAGQRYTGNRRELLELFATVSEPLTIPEILAHRRDLAQSSVYRNLAVLEQAGLVQ